MIWLMAASLLVVGLWSVVAGLLFRAGRLRRLGSWYFDTRLPFWLRNFVFAAVPAGCIGLALFLVFPLAQVDALWAEYAMLTAVLLTLLAFAVSIAFMIKPPRVLKPEWLIGAETERDAGSDDS